MYFDTGGCLYSSYKKNNDFILNVSFLNEYLEHVGNSSCSFTYDYPTQKVEQVTKLKEDLMKYCNGITIPVLKEEHFNEHRFDRRYLIYSEKIRKKTSVFRNIACFKKIS